MSTDTDRHDPRIDEWPVADHEDTQFVGTTTVSSDGRTVPVFYDAATRTFFGTDFDEDNEQLRRLSDREWLQDPTETVGESIERLGEELGWESLSEFAETHLEDDG